MKAQLAPEIARLDDEWPATLANRRRAQGRIDGDVRDRPAREPRSRVLPLAQADERARAPAEPRALERVARQLALEDLRDVERDRCDCGRQLGLERLLELYAV
jgi:hypothetical protein